MTTVELVIERDADRNAVRRLLADRYEVVSRNGIEGDHTGTAVEGDRNGVAVGDDGDGPPTGGVDDADSGSRAVEGNATVGESDLYLVDERDFPAYTEALRARVAGDDPVFCPIVLIGRPGSAVDPAQATSVDREAPVIVDEVLEAPLTRMQLRRSVDSLLARREQSLTLHRERNELRTFREVVEHSGHAIVITDPNGRIEYVNPAFETVTGYSREEAIGHTPRLWKSGEHDRAFYEDLWGTITDGEVWHSEMVNERKDGEQFVVDQTIAPVLDGAGEVTRFVAVNHDITERTERERDLERYETIVETAADAIYMLDVDGRFTMANRRTTELTGFDREALIGSHVSLLLDDADVDRGRRLIREQLAGDELPVAEFEATVETTTGDRFPADLRIAPLFDDDELRGTVGLARDVTERKRAEKRRRRLLEATRAILEKTDRESVLEFTTDVTADILGFARNVVRLREGDVLVPVAVTEGAHANLGDRPTYPMDPADNPVARAFGRSEPVVVDDLGELADGYDRGEAAAGMYIPIGDVGVLSVVELTPGAFGASDVELASILAANAESALHRVEYERVLQKQRDRLETLNQVMRHDIRNDLQLVSAYAELAEDHADTEGRAHLDVVRESAENAIDLTMTAGVLAEAMLQSDADTHSVSLAESIERQLETIRAAHPDAAVSVEGSLPGTSVRANELLDAVFRNVLKNAIRHNDKPDPTVTVSARTNGDRATVRIADNGPGVPDDCKESIFGEGKKGLESDGTGIGLYLVCELVAAFGGDVWVEDNDPEGAVFAIELPTAA